MLNSVITLKYIYLLWKNNPIVINTIPKIINKVISFILIKFFKNIHKLVQVVKWHP